MYIIDMTYKDKADKKTMHIKNFRISIKDHEKLKRAADENGTTITNVIRNLIHYKL